MGLGDDGPDAQEEGGVAGDHLGIGVSAHIAHVGIGDGTGVQELLELHAGHHAGDIAGLVGVGEDVLQVGQAGGGGVVAGAGDEDHVLELGGSLLHVALMAVGVGEDDGAALLGQIHGGVVAVFILGHVVLDDELGVQVQAQVLAGGGQALDVGHVVAGVLVVEHDAAHLDGGGGLGGGGPCGSGGGGGRGAGRGALAAGAGAGGQAQDHDAALEQGENSLFHFWFLLISGWFMERDTRMRYVKTAAIAGIS